MSAIPYHWRVLSVITLGTLLTGVNVSNGMRLTLQTVGNTLGIAVALTLIASTLARAYRPLVYAGTVPDAALPDLLGGFHRAIVVMLVMAVLTVPAAIASLVGERSPDIENGRSGTKGVGGEYGQDDNLTKRSRGVV